MKRILAGLTTALLMLAALSPVLAQSASGSLQIEFVENQGASVATRISGATFGAWRVGDAQVDFSGPTYTLLQKYARFNNGKTLLNGLKESQMRALIAPLEQEIRKSGEAAVYTAATGGDGRAVMSGMELGVYLVRQTGASGVAARYELAESFLIFIPTADGGQATALAYPKAEPTPRPTPTPTPTPTGGVTPTPTVATATPVPSSTPTGTPTDTPAPTPYVTPTPKPNEVKINLAVRKDWADSGDADGVRPASITLYLFKKPSTQTAYPETAETSVTIQGAGDQWYFTFFGLTQVDTNGIRYDYLVREEAVPGYSALYQDEDGIIVNVHPTYTPAPGTTPRPYEPTPEPTQTPKPSPGVPVGMIEIDGEWYFIDDYGVPLGLVPQTGDESDLLLYAVSALLLLAMAAVLGCSLSNRRRRS